MIFFIRSAFPCMYLIYNSWPNELSAFEYFSWIFAWNSNGISSDSVADANHASFFGSDVLDVINFFSYIFYHITNNGHTNYIHFICDAKINSPMHPIKDRKSFRVCMHAKKLFKLNIYRKSFLYLRFTHFSSKNIFDCCTGKK